MATTTQTSSVDPALLPYLTQGLERAQSLFLTGQQPEFFPGQTYVSPSAATTEALTEQEKLARAASPLLTQAQQAYTSSLTGIGGTAGGSFLNANPYQSKVLYPAVFRDLDFKTIDKLCKMNKEFEKFIEQTEKLMTASEKYVSGAEKELDEFCDSYFANDTEVENYCKEKHIPINEE